MSFSGSSFCTTKAREPNTRESGVRISWIVSIKKLSLILSASFRRFSASASLSAASRWIVSFSLILVTMSCSNSFLLLFNVEIVNSSSLFFRTKSLLACAKSSFCSRKARYLSSCCSICPSNNLFKESSSSFRVFTSSFRALISLFRFSSAAFSLIIRSDRSFILECNFLT